VGVSSPHKTVQGTARNIERKALNGKNAPITNIARKNKTLQS